MNKFSKLIRSNLHRKTRFHTARGNLVSMSEILKVPYRLYQRYFSKTNIPWITEGAINWLDENLNRDMLGVELGSGSSTIWYASKLKHLTSYESNPDWYKNVTKTFKDKQINNVTLKYKDIDKFLDEIPGEIESDIDLLVVDCDEHIFNIRTLLIKKIMGKIKIGGVIVLDDSDQAIYNEVFELLKNWDIYRFQGIKAKPLMGVETSIFVKKNHD